MAKMLSASTAHRFISEDSVVNARAQVLDEGSCLNAWFYMRSSNDYMRVAGWDARLATGASRGAQDQGVGHRRQPDELGVTMVFIPSPVPIGLSLMHVVGITRSGSFIKGMSGSEFGITVLMMCTVARAISRNVLSPDRATGGAAIEAEDDGGPAALSDVFAEPSGEKSPLLP
ncbi:hypothetical protein GUJ93_ZPchr0012g22178 [Zizania palustris]|uniref:Uncharacterized protein n=1 Tax=Zizania palustris TaxID=103762 RepID=A0A8J5WKL3_ZIZPA|nr:hypothetical protein GUJ93_ZPchr0012g22178 [Zizania palustris]